MVASPSALEIARATEWLLLAPELTREERRRHCETARSTGLPAVVVHGSQVIETVHWLDESDVKVVVVVGFPLGLADADVKRYEVEAAIDSGAHEVELVLSSGQIRDGDDARLLRELRDAVEAADERRVRVAIETCLLNRDEKHRMADLVAESGARGIVAGTGWGKRGATIDDVKLFREVLPPNFIVKAVGGIVNPPVAVGMLGAGADRLGVLPGATLF